GAGNPIVPLDAFRDGLDFPRDFGDIARCPSGDLNVCVGTHFVQRAFDDRSDAVNFLEVVPLGGIRVLVMSDLKTELIGPAVRPRHDVAAFTNSKCSANFDQSLSET